MKLVSMLAKYFLTVVLSILILKPAWAQNKIIPIETEHTTQVLQVSENQDLDIIYFGKKLSNPDVRAGRNSMDLRISEVN